ncbi:hypothetical protein KA082_00525 [Candidatus Woesebacteria bacterium]|nr:hypothetical protein [Candidatus Woesebacteria bacterium]
MRVLLTKLQTTVLIFGGIFCLCAIFFYGQYQFSDLSFDAQSLLTWQYAAQSGVIPYKEVFYPYGLLQYYSDSSAALQGISVLLCSIYFFVIYQSLAVVTRSKRTALAILLLFFLFVGRFTGFLSFVRYGGALVFGLWLVLQSVYRSVEKKSIQVQLGVLSGLLLTLFLDQGVYAVGLYCAVSVLLSVQKSKPFSVGALLRSLLMQGQLFSMGFLLGSAPLWIFLLYFGALTGFIHTLQYLPELSIYAKAPFFSSFRKPEIIFITSSCIAGVWFLTQRIVVDKKKLQAGEYFVYVTTLLLLLVSIKNVVRLIDREITPFAVLNGVYIFFLMLKKDSIGFFGIGKKGMLALICLFFLVLQPFFVDTQFRQRSFKQKTVFDQVSQLLVTNPRFEQVLTTLRAQNDFSGHVFSYPTDPIFYILLKQKPPHYFQTYDASAQRAQLEQIKYIEEKNVSYVIYNTSIPALQDAVPDYMRSNTLLKYILTHFTARTQSHEFLLLVRSSSADFLTDAQFPAQLKEELSHVNFGSVPLSEGIHVLSLLEKKPVIAFKYLSGVERTIYFPEKSIQANEVALSLSCQTTTTQSITMTSVDGVVTTVSVDCREQYPVVINLGRVPVFFTDRKLQSIAYSQDLSNPRVFDITTPPKELW